jgi:D-hexose-6-phosphate mutarotase
MALSKIFVKTAELAQRFAIDKKVRIVDASPNYPLIEIDNSHATASIALHGAQVLSYQPHGQEPVLWVSKDAVYAEGKSVRGGVPICWPWFGAHPDADKASHGFVRNCFWQLRSIQQLADDCTEIVLFLEDDQHSRSLWPLPFVLEFRVSVGRSLSLSLTMTNRATVPQAITAALHSYFYVGDIASTAVLGLEHVEYLDALQGFRRFTQSGDIRFNAELDRIYERASADEWIHDEALGRKIRLQKKNSQSTVVWNPWIDKSARMDDFEEEGYRRMVCVETGNIASDAVALAPGMSHTLGVEISVEDLVAGSHC